MTVASPLRAVLLAIGLCLCVAAWLAPLEALLPGPFSAHMLRHVGVIAVATPLIAAGLDVDGVARAVPPLGAVALEFAVVWAWHLPGAHDAAQVSPLWFAAEQASFFAVGLLVWLSVLERSRALAGAGALLLTSMHMTLLGALVVLSGRGLYVCAGGEAAGLADQQIGGMIMLAVATPVYLAGGLVLVARALNARMEGAT